MSRRNGVGRPELTDRSKVSTRWVPLGTLRLRILVLGVGAATAVLVLLAVPVSVTLVDGARTQTELEAVGNAQGIADSISTGALARADLSAIVDRANTRGDQPITVVLADGTRLGQDQAACSVDTALNSGGIDPSGTASPSGLPSATTAATGTLPAIALVAPAPAPALAPASAAAGSAVGVSDVMPAAAVRREDDGPGVGGGGGGGDRGGDRGGDESSDLLPTSQASVSDVPGGRLITIVTVDGTGDAAVCAFAASTAVRQSVAGRLVALGLASAAILAVVGLAALLLARRLVGHLSVAAETADRLGEGDLTARVPEAGPTEVRRVGAALNRLAGRIDELLTLERETVADLSHRLRTPLTAVRLDVEALPDSPAKAELEDHLATLERTLTAVIAAARRPQREGVQPRSDVVTVVADRFAYWSPLMEDQGRETSLVVDLTETAVLVRCAREDLAAALDALLENAVAHTEEGVAVRVILANAETDGAVHLDVSDRGPGVPSIALQRGRSDRGSSGLGLDIARSCAQASGGELELLDDDGWSVVRLRLGRN